jgi:hypothetical protein
MKRIDILETDDGDELIEDGDFAIGESDALHVRDLILDAPGDWRQNPVIGFMADRYKNAKATKRRQFESELREMLELDGYKVNSIDLTMSEWWKNFTVDVEPIK